MTSRLKTLLTIATTGLFLAGPGISARAQDAIGEAPLVSGLEDLRKLNEQSVRMSAPSAAATVSLISRGAGGAGSGVVVSPDGLILTAAHVVDSLSDEVIVIFPDGSRKPAKPLGGDFDRDAAMVQITEEGDYPHVKVGSSRNLLRNQWCVALGHPGGFDPARTPPVRLGRVLESGPFITTDCAVVGGDSGGPLFDAEGRVIGIHSNIGVTLTENRHVPIEVFLESWEDMKSGKRTGRRFAGGGQRVDPNRAVLGVNLGEPGEDGGVELEGVMEKSPAEKVGLQAGDVITKINGDGVTGAEELIRAVNEFKAGDELKISYRREGEERDVVVKLARLGDLMERTPPRRERRLRRPRREGPEPAGEEPHEDAKPKEEPAAKGEKEAPQEAAKEEGVNPLQELLDRALKEGHLELDEEDLERLGGLEGLRENLEDLADAVGPEALRGLLRMRDGEPDTFYASSIEALGPVTRIVADSTVTVLVDGVAAALGTVVSEKGHILTKDSETKNGVVAMQREGKGIPLNIVKRFPKRDLALFQGASEGLVPVRWAGGKLPLPIGSVLTASDSAGQPLGIGLVSVQTRALGDVGFLGIQAGEAEGGIRIVRTINSGPAREAGLRNDDFITAVDGKEFRGPFEFGQLIRSYRAGDEVELTYRRGEKVAKLKLKLAARDESQGTPRFRRMNELSGPLSARLTGFPEALQHDIPISPVECGGPLLDLDGRCVGINVSRAGRVKTLAVPASDVLKLLAELKLASIAEPKAKAAGPKADEAKKKEREKVLKELGEVEKRLKELKGELEELKAK